jgi:hypothetical protein
VLSLIARAPMLEDEIHRRTKSPCGQPRRSRRNDRGDARGMGSGRQSRQRMAGTCINALVEPSPDHDSLPTTNRQEPTAVRTHRLGLWRQIPRLAIGRESVRPVASIAERHIRGLTATAQRNDGAAAESEFFACGIVHTEITFDANGTVVGDCNFRWRHALRW